jgi:Protein of unknown function (DUF2806)
MASDLVPQDPDGLIARWLAQLFGGLHVPGAVKAISHLVTGAAEVPSAGFSWLSDRIKDDSFMRSEAMKLIVAASVREAERDPEFASRALTYQSRKLRQEQRNRETIVMKALGNLHETPPPEGFQEEPTDDFLNLFGARAAHASSDELQDLFARILAGEIRKPGSFSLQTIQLVSVIDRRLATALKTARAWIFWDAIPQITSESVLKPGTVGLLQDMNLLRGDLQRSFAATEMGNVIAMLGNKAVVLYGTKTINVPIWALSESGREIMSLIPYIEDENYLAALPKGLFTASFPADFSKGALTRVVVAEVNASGQLASWFAEWPDQPNTDVEE